jgi:hypothetical protein
VWWELESENGAIKLTWGSGAELGYPPERYFAGMIESMIGESFEKGLNNIKKIAETPVLEEAVPED